MVPSRFPPSPGGAPSRVSVLPPCSRLVPPSSAVHSPRAPCAGFGPSHAFEPSNDVHSVTSCRLHASTRTEHAHSRLTRLLTRPHVALARHSRRCAPSDAFGPGCSRDPLRLKKPRSDMGHTICFHVRSCATQSRCLHSLIVSAGNRVPRRTGRDCGFSGGQTSSDRTASRRSEVGPSRNCLARSTVPQISSKRVAFPRLPRCSFTAHARPLLVGVNPVEQRISGSRAVHRRLATRGVRPSVRVEGRAGRPSTFSASALSERTGLPRNQLVPIADQERCELPARTLTKLADESGVGNTVLLVGSAKR